MCVRACVCVCACVSVCVCVCIACEETVGRVLFIKCDGTEVREVLLTMK